eukprot:UN11024
MEPPRRATYPSVFNIIGGRDAELTEDEKCTESTGIIIKKENEEKNVPVYSNM